MIVIQEQLQLPERLVQTVTRRCSLQCIHDAVQNSVEAIAKILIPDTKSELLLTTHSVCQCSRDLDLVLRPIEDALQRSYDPERCLSEADFGLLKKLSDAVVDLAESVNEELCVIAQHVQKNDEAVEALLRGAVSAAEKFLPPLAALRRELSNSLSAARKLESDVQSELLASIKIGERILQVSLANHCQFASSDLPSNKLF